MKLAEWILLGGLTLFGLVLILNSSQLDYRGDNAFGPGFIPVNSAILLILVCIWRAYSQIRNIKLNGNGLNLLVPDTLENGAQPNFKGLILAIGIMLLGVLSMSFGSVLLSIFAIMLLLSWFVSRHPFWLAFGVSFVTIAVIYLIFVVWLGLPVQ